MENQISRPSKQRAFPLVQVPLCYLDWNIFDNFSKKRLPELKDVLFTAREDGLIHVPYTEWHLHEAVNVSSDLVNQEELVSRNLETLKDVTDFVCIWEHDEPAGWRILRFAWDRQFDVLTTQKLVMLWEMMKPILAAITTVKDKLLEFGLVPGTLNKFTPDEVIQEIDRILCKPENIEKYKEYSPKGITLEEIINLALSIIPESADDLQLVSAIYFLVDQIGYYSDKSVKRNVMSLWRDQNHVAWASRSQILVSADRRLRMKAKLTYRIFGITTLVLDPNEAIVTLKWMLENSDALKFQYDEVRKQTVA